MEPWSVLGIAPTNDSKVIRKAYNKSIALHHPEDDPEGFMLVRTAYEQILKLLEEVQDAAPDMDIIETNKEAGHEDISIADTAQQDCFQEVLALYTDFFRRIRKNQWEQLFASMCMETYSDFEENAPYFFNQYYYLPSDIWLYMDAKFALFSDERFLHYDAFFTQIGFSYEIFDTDIVWDYEQYLELRYQGAVCYLQNNYSRALNYFQQAFGIYGGELALRVKMGQIYYAENRADDVALVLGSITRLTIEDIQDFQILQLMFHIIDSCRTAGIDLFVGIADENKIDMTNILILYLYDILVLYTDFYSRIDARNWENQISTMPEEVRENFLMLAPYFFNICCCIPFSVWEFVNQHFSLEHNKAFLKCWIFCTDIRMDYVLYHPSLSRQCEEYMWNWYSGMEAYILKDYKKVISHLNMTFSMFAEDLNVFRALTEAYFALGNISDAKRCYDAYPEMDWYIEEVFNPPETAEINFEKSNKISISTFFEQKCRKFLDQKNCIGLFWSGLGYRIFGSSYALNKAFFLRALFEQEKYGWLNFFRIICPPVWNDNFEAARFFIQMQQAGLAEYSSNYTKQIVRNEGRRRGVAAFFIIAVCAIIGILFL